MQFKDAAYEVLKKAGQPLHYKEKLLKHHFLMPMYVIFQDNLKDGVVILLAIILFMKLYEINLSLLSVHHFPIQQKKANLMKL